MKYKLLGAIIGDIIGSTYEWARDKQKIKDTPVDKIKLFPSKSKFTDDTVCTCAIAEWLMDGGDLSTTMQSWCNKYPYAGYGGLFRKWIKSDNPKPYNSYGNGSGMRVSPVGYYAFSKEDCISLAKQSAEITHNHPEGIKGAQAIALAVWYAYMSIGGKDWIKNNVLDVYYPEWKDKTIDEIKPEYKFDSTCQGSVPAAIICFLESKDYEDCIRKAISLAGDTDTVAAMAGSIAHAYYGYIDKDVIKMALSMLPKDIIDVVNRFDLFIDEGYNK